MPADGSAVPKAPTQQGRTKARVRPMGGAATAAPASGLAKAQYVLAVLEEVALDVNDKVRQQEESMRVLEQLGLGNAAVKDEVAAAILGPAASLVLELRVDLTTNASGQLLGLAKPSWRQKLLKRKRSSRPGKLFLFRDRLLIARTASQSDTFEMVACWPLDDVARGPPELAGDARTTISLMRYATSGELSQKVEVTCSAQDAMKLCESMNELHRLVDNLRRRQGRGPRASVAAQLAVLEADATAAVSVG
jgi:hypothetical protein